jgi:hypothetical protein
MKQKMATVNVPIITFSLAFHVFRSLSRRPALSHHPALSHIILPFPASPCPISHDLNFSHVILPFLALPAQFSHCPTPLASPLYFAPHAFHIRPLLVRSMLYGT